jgi:protein-tyrosine phosphatase
MAAHLMQQRLAVRLGRTVDQLEECGLLVMSAGIAAMSGGCASHDAIRVMSDRGIDLSRHESQPLSDRLVRFADVIFTMTRGHRDAILAQWPGAASRTIVLGGAQGDVADPIGGTVEIYRKCADQIDEFLTPHIEGLDLDSILAADGLGG